MLSEFWFKTLLSYAKVSLLSARSLICQRPGAEDTLFKTLCRSAGANLINEPGAMLEAVLMIASAQCAAAGHPQATPQRPHPNMELGLIWGHAPLGMGLDSAEAYATGVTPRGCDLGSASKKERIK
jgi:hypothetical protein